MDRRTKQWGVVVCLMAMSFFAGWPFWKWVDKRAASMAVQTRTRALVDNNPQLKPAWDVAMQDEVLTGPEAEVIVKAAGETIDEKK